MTPPPPVVTSDLLTGAMNDWVMFQVTCRFYVPVQVSCLLIGLNSNFFFRLLFFVT